MRKTFSIILLGLTSLLMFFLDSCKEVLPVDRENSTISVILQSLNVSQTELRFTTDKASSLFFVVTSSNVEWEITDIPNWITVNPKSGGDGRTTVAVSVTENTVATDRMALFSFKAKDDTWSYSQHITVSQVRARYYAIPETDRVEFDGSSSNRVLKVNSNLKDWTAFVSTNVDWCSVSKGNGTVTLSVTPNTGDASRECKIQIETPDGVEYISVIQRPANISSTTELLEFEVGGGSQTVQISSDAEWTCNTSYSWISVTPESGMAGNSTITVQVLANNTLDTRNGYVYVILSDSRKIEIPVSQEGISFSVDNTQIQLPYDGSEYKMSVQSNVDWKLLDSIPSWLSVSPRSGSGNSQVSVSANVNTSYKERTFEFKIAPVSLTNAATKIKVTQNGLTFETDSTALHFSDKAGSAFFNIKTDGSWIVTTSAPWITVDKEAGTGNSQITVSVDENTADTARVGDVFASVEDKKVKISVYQQGKYINVSSDALEFTSKGDSTQITIKTNNSWIAQSSAEWIKLSKTEGADDCDLIISATDNASVNSRSGHVDIIPNGQNPIRINVNQAPRYLSVLSDTLYFFYKGGVSDPVAIETDGSAEISTDNDWLTINRISDTQFTVSATKNENENNRIGSIVVRLTDLIEGEKSVNVVVMQYSGIHNGVEYVDLGLSVKWATCNLGASSPEETGNYYAWGETETKSDYTWDTYAYGTENALTKYCLLSEYGKDNMVDNLNRLEKTDDPARVELGGFWRTPTDKEVEELFNNCSITRTEKNGVDGYELRSKIKGFENRTLFIPNTGFKYGSEINNENYYFWTNTLHNEISTRALAAAHVFNDYLLQLRRCCGLPVRPVCSKEIWPDSISIVIESNTQNVDVDDCLYLTATVKSGINILDCGVSWVSANPEIATVSKIGVVTGHNPGSTTITATCLGKTANIVITVIEPQYKYVDLGLSVKWATRNVGASKPEEYGDYFAWGEIESKSSYSWSSYKWSAGTSSSLTKYNTNANLGSIDNKKSLELQDDVAKAIWGDYWRMPSREEQIELIENCSWEWTTVNETNGYRITSNIPGYTDRSIFLPAAGFMDGQYLYDATNGSYWSSSLNSDNPSTSWNLEFYSTQDYEVGSDNRNRGLPIRPVCPSNTWIDAVTIVLDFDSLTMTEGDSSLLNVTLKHGADLLDREVMWSSADQSIATVNQQGLVSGVSPGITTITASCLGKKAICIVTVEEYTYGYVDLGLSVNWAKCNVGASAPEEYGDFYAWGETEAKMSYTWSNYKFRTEGSKFGSIKYSKYNSEANRGTVDNKTVLDLEDDVAHVMMGGSWRMPTETEQKELQNNCTWTWTTLNGVYGYQVTSNVAGYESASIFLPAAGYRDDVAYNEGTFGNYWSSTLYNGNTDYARDFDFSYGFISVGTGGRYSGLPVRAVFPADR